MEVAARFSASIAVLGGGPAGSVAAALLARHGVDVILIEKERFPRDKVCGEFLSWDALPVLERAGVSLEGAGAPRIVRCRIATAGGDAEFPLPAPALGISRYRFDEILLRNAARSGARLLESTSVTAIAREAGGFRIAARCVGAASRRPPGWDVGAASRRPSGWDAPDVLDDVLDDRATEGDERAIEIEARAVIGAWGRWGRIDLGLRRPFVRDRRHRYIGFKRHYGAGLTEPDLIELHSFARGYLGAQAVENGRSNLCGLVHQEAIAALRGGWPEFVDRLRERHRPLARLLERAEPAQEAFLSSEPVIFRPKSPIDGEIFLAGDAAGLIDPLTGNGMAMAVQSGALVVAPVLESLAGDPERALRSYAHAHRELFARRLFWSRRCADVLQRPALLEWSVRLGRSTGLGAALARATRATPRQIETLLRGLP